jgi:hypothetical protein
VDDPLSCLFDALDKEAVHAILDLMSNSSDLPPMTGAIRSVCTNAVEHDTSEFK